MLRLDKTRKLGSSVILKRHLRLSTLSLLFHHFHYSQLHETSSIHAKSLSGPKIRAFKLYRAHFGFLDIRYIITNFEDSTIFVIGFIGRKPSGKILFASWGSCWLPFLSIQQSNRYSINFFLS